MRSQSAGPAVAAGTAAVWDARLSAPGSPVCTPDWLALREPADAAARSVELVGSVAAHLGARRPVTVRDLGCGSGSLGRWLAPRLPGPQVWVLHDRDPGLLALAEAGMPDAAADGGAVTAEVRQGDIAGLRGADLAGTSLVTASALLDLLTAVEVDGLAAACVEAGCAALLTLTVSGDVTLTPAEPLDGAFAAAFDDHQRRVTGGRRLLGPDAGAVAAAAFASHGARVLTRPSPWRVGPGEADLAEEWLRGWIGAACEQRPELGRHAAAYLQRRLDTCAADGLRVTVGHVDLLALPGGAR